MSSDTYYIRVLAIEGLTVDLLCRTSTAGGLNDYAVTRSFALMAIDDCMPSPWKTQTPLQARLREVAGSDTPPVWETSFHVAHVGEFIRGTELLERIGIIDDEAAWGAGREAEDNPDPEKDFPLHRFVLRVHMTDARWLEGLEVGASGGTTAFDAWWEDPTRPSLATIDEITAKATRWRPPAARAT